MPEKRAAIVSRIQIVGGVLFLSALMLPAVRVDTSAAGVLHGYECVGWSSRMLYESLRELYRPDGLHPWTLSLIFGTCGAINPLLAGYLLANAKWRRRLSILICVLFIETWIALALSEFTPLIGHFVWVAGALLLMAPEFSAWQGEPSEESGTP